jgi:hypothetical protein
MAISSCRHSPVGGWRIPSTLRRIFRANTLSRSSGAGLVKRTSQTRAKVPGVGVSVLDGSLDADVRTSPQCLHQLKAVLVQQF